MSLHLAEFQSENPQQSQNSHNLQIEYIMVISNR